MASVLDLVKHYQRAIEKYPNDEQKILKSIDKLYNLRVTVQHLQDTGVGRTVNALRKEPGEVGQAARALVLKWKVMVAAEESDQEEDHNDDTQTYSTHDNGRDYESNSGRSTSRHDTSEKSERRLKTEEKYDRDTNGDYSGHKRKYQSSEEEDHDTKKSKYSRDNGYNVRSDSQVKTEPTESEESQDESSQSDSSEDSQSEDDDERIPEIETKVQKNYDTKDSQKSSHLKQSFSSHQDKPKHDSRHTKEETKHTKNYDNSDKRHTSDKAKEKSQSSHSHRSSREHDKSSDKKDKENRHSEKEKQSKEDSSKHSDKHKSSSSSDKNKSISTEKQKSSNSSDKHKSSENLQKHKSSRSEDKHKSSSSSEKNKKLSPENNKNHSEKTSSNTDKQSSHKSDKERHKKSEKESSNDKHKSKERNDRKDEEIKDKSKEKHSSSKDKESHKSEKRHSSKETELRDSKRKSESSSSSDNSKKSKHKSSSSKQSSKSKDKEKLPKKAEDSDGGIDCGSGASFAEALGMISPSKPKKKSIFSKENIQFPYSPNGDLSPPNLLAPTAKLAPLPSLEISALPEISPNYRPRPPPKFLPHFSDEDAMSSAVSSKNQRTKVYSGNKVIGKITTLYEMCVQVLQEHIDALEYTGGVPYEILKPVVDKATPQQLFVLEHYNPYLMDDTDHLWQKFCEKSFRNKKRQEMETWREMYIRCQEEQEIKLKSLTANIRMTQEAKKAPIKQTKMAYVDTVVKPPRNVAKKQAQHGTAFAATASPAARVASLSAAPNVLKGGRAAPAPVLTNSSSFKPKKAPLMQKALQFMRGRKR